MSRQTNLMLDPTEGTQTPKTGTDLELACRRCIETTRATSEPRRATRRTKMTNSIMAKAL